MSFSGDATQQLHKRGQTSSILLVHVLGTLTRQRQRRGHPWPPMGGIHTPRSTITASLVVEL